MSNPIKIYSPSQTRDWDRCPTFRKFRQQGINKILGGKKTVAAMFGVSVAEGLAAHNIARMNGKVMDMGTAATIAIKTWSLEVAWKKQHGMVIPEELLKGKEKMISDAFDSYEEAGGLPVTWTILAVEKELLSRSRIDLAVQDGNGRVWIVDYKTKQYLTGAPKPDGTMGSYYKTFVEAYLSDWQMYHYAWEWRQKTGIVPAGFIIAAMVIAPEFSFNLHPYAIGDLDRWAASAHATWNLMQQEDEGDIPVRMSTSHYDQYGRCEMYEKCYGTPKLAAETYTVIPRRPNLVSVTA